MWNISTPRPVLPFVDNRKALVLLLALSATAAGAWARQVKSADGDEVRTVDVVASRFAFEPASIQVVEGERVRFRLHSADVPHSFAIKAFRVKTPIPKGDAGVMVEFVAERAGTYDFTCTEYCGNGHSRMKGKLVVVAAGR